MTRPVPSVPPPSRDYLIGLGLIGVAILIVGFILGALFVSVGLL